MQENSENMPLTGCIVDDIKYEKFESNNVCMLIRNCAVGKFGLQKDSSINFAFKHFFMKYLLLLL